MNTWHICMRGWTSGSTSSMRSDRLRRFVLKPVVFLVCLLPLALLTWNAFTGGLTANPIDDITDTTGRWTLRFLLITLAIRPLRQITGWSVLIRFRRMIGLFAFFHGALHFTTYIWLDQFFDIAEILRDIPKRPFITAGFTAFVCMIPLAITSTKRWISWLGGRRWLWLHRLVYVSSTAGVVHYLWIVKADTLKPLTYGALLTVLMGYRLVVYLRPQILATRVSRGQERVEA